MKIIGAGLAGLLAATLLRRHGPRIFEAQDRLPDNHGALLRFRSSKVSEATGQPFLRVPVTKGLRWAGEVSTGPAPIPALNRYSLKATGSVLPRSVMSLDPSIRWIAPGDFTAVLAAGVEVTYGMPVTGDAIRGWAAAGEPIVSTMPMPHLMKAMGWTTSLNFESYPIWSLRTRLTWPKVEVYQTIYYPEEKVPWYRASITGNLLIIESRDSIDPENPPKDWVDLALRDFGIYRAAFSPPHVHYQKYGKLAPVEEDAERKAFILAMTDQFGIYSLGRFGTWRQILLDDVVDDIRAINMMISERDIYSRHKVRP